MQVLIFLSLLESLVCGYGSNPSLDKVCTTQRCSRCRDVVQNIPSRKPVKTTGLFQFCRTILSINECCPGRQMLLGVRTLTEDVCELVENTNRDCKAYDELKNDEFLCEAFKSRTETDEALCASNFGRVEHGMNLILLVGIVCLVVSVATCVVLAYCYFKHMYIIYGCRNGATSRSKSPLLKGTPVNSPAYENSPERQSQLLRSYEATANAYENDLDGSKK